MAEAIGEIKKSWARKLFQKSPLKQKKFQMLSKMIAGENYSHALDIGSDNGVISMLLREKGGEWKSADLLPETVESIRGLVGGEVFQIDGKTLPLPDESLDLVVIVDMLEHIHTDKEFVAEIKRVLKSGGVVIANVPNPKEGLIRKIQRSLGQTDAAHGHVRPGYSLDALKDLFADFSYEKSEPYSRFFSVAIDTWLTFVLDKLKKGGRGKKGTVLTKDDLTKMQKSFKLYSLIYPFVAIFVALDKLIPFTHGAMLIGKFRKK